MERKNMSTGSFLQDLPPSGGYKPYKIERTITGRLMPGPILLGAFAVITIGGIYSYIHNWKIIAKQNIEMRGARNVMYAILLAERDRAVLKYMKINREAERELMKNVPHWEIGKYFIDPIYETYPEDRFIEPTANEMFAFAKPSQYNLIENLHDLL